MSAPHTEAHDLAHRFREDGFVAVPDFFDRATVDGVLSRIAEIKEGRLNGLQPERLYYETPGAPETLKQIQELFRWDGFFNDLMYAGAAPDLARTLLADEVVPQNMQYFNKPPGASTPTPPHQDGFYFMLEPCEAVTMWLALEPVDAENGCVRYLKGSHKAGLKPHGRTDVLGFSQAVEGFEALRARYEEISLAAAPGTLLVHHALTVHRADANRSPDRTRQALGFIYYARRARVDTARHAAYQERLAADLARAGRV